MRRWMKWAGATAVLSAIALPVGIVRGIIWLRKRRR